MPWVYIPSQVPVTDKKLISITVHSTYPSRKTSSTGLASISPSSYPSQHTPAYHPHRTMYRTSALLLAIAPLVPANPVSMAPRESSTGCSNSSLHNFEWQVEAFDFHASYIFSTPAHQNSWGYASFNLTNPAVPDVVTSCSASSNTVNDFFYGSPWYTCTASGTPDPAPASFAFNRPTGELKINQTWTCFDADPKYP